MIAAVFDTGALIALQNEQLRRLVLRRAREDRVNLLVPTPVITEFMIGFSARHSVIGDRVLASFIPVDVTREHAYRAAAIGRAWPRVAGRRRAKRRPSVVDLIVAAIGERHRIVVTSDQSDFSELASAAATGFDVYGVLELLSLFDA